MARALRFGVAIVASEPPDEFIQTVRLAEELGFDSVWVPDAWLNRDVFVSLALAALNTTRVRLGCSVTNVYTRHPALTAVGAASVDSISNGRMVLGLGAGGVVLDLLKIERRQPLLACRDAVQDIRRYLVNSAEQGVSKPAADSENMRLGFQTRADLPIFIAATGRKMLKLAGEIADGVIVNVGVYPACVEKALATIAAGAWSAQRPREALELVCWLQGCAVSTDAAEALNTIKPIAALTLSHTPAWMLETMEIDRHEVREIHKVYYTDGPQAAAQLVSDEIADKFAVAGTPEQVVRKIKRLRAQGFDEIIFLPAKAGGNIRTAMRTLAETIVAVFKGK